MRDRFLGVTPPPTDLLTWLREQCAEYQFDVRGVFRKDSPDSSWPVEASGPDDLEHRLASGGHLLPLPSEPAALANIIEVSLVDFLVSRLQELDGAVAQRGTERGYPDLEISGEAFGGGYHAVDVKVAKRKPAPRTRADQFRPKTQSRITLYTGNTFFKHPTLKWPGTFRPFGTYEGHLDVIALYTLVETAERVADLELLVHPPWAIASRSRSSTTREYIGAVDGIEDLRAGRGEFESPDEFYAYWRKFKFKVSPHVQAIQERLMREQAEEIGRLRAAAEQERPGQP